MQKYLSRCGRVCTIADKKRLLRRQIREIEAAVTDTQRASSDFLLQQRFLDLAQVQRADTILLYASMGKEVDTEPLLRVLSQQGKRVLLPCCMPGNEMIARVYDSRRLCRHPYGMWEPSSDCEAVEKQNIDLILVPGVCYDRSCMRLGRGGGFYDRYLADYQGMTVGWCREVLLWEKIPAEPWDRPVQLVLTEQEEIYN